MATRFEKIAELVRKHPVGKLSTLVHHIDLASLEESYRRLSGVKAVGDEANVLDNYVVNMLKSSRKAQEGLLKAEECYTWTNNQTTAAQCLKWRFRHLTI